MTSFKYVVKLEGGLGNQLFQYAHAMALQSKFGGKIILDKHAFNKKQIRSCALENYVLNENTKCSITLIERLISLYFISLSRLVGRRMLITNHHQYERFVKKGLYYQYATRWFDSLLPPQMPINYITGNWLSDKCFSSAGMGVRQALTFKGCLSKESMGILDEIRSSESVCIHIRLGDYLLPQWRDKLFICTPEYYSQAMAMIKEKVEAPKFFVFSNRPKDFEIIRNDYSLGEVIYVNLGNSDVEDLELMRNCKHFVMSNSTYSWWAQYLSDNPNKVVMAPSRFNNYPQWDMKDIYQDNWTLISV